MLPPSNVPNQPPLTNFILRGPGYSHVGSLTDPGYVGKQDRLLDGMHGMGDRSRRTDNNSSSAYPLHYSSQSSPSSPSSYTRHQTRLRQRIPAFQGSNIIPRHPINTRQTTYNRMSKIGQTVPWRLCNSSFENGEVDQFITYIHKLLR